MKRFYIPFIFVFILFTINKISAQCNKASIIEADKSYLVGNFTKVINELEPCINEELSDTLKVEAYRLLSKTYIALDDDSLAMDYTSKLLSIQPDFQPNILTDPTRFIEMIDELKNMVNKVLVTSVSKKAENIVLAPATVVSISKKEFINRGYLDFEAMLYDLPGFDISRSNGNLYTHIYQRGYRSINTNRTLFLIDGVEDNDIWSSNVYLSRQFSISNLKSVEVVYGPASTMYGSNAFLGVINIITKEPSELIEKGKRIGFSVIGGYGYYNTKSVDATFAAQDKKGNISFSLTGRGYFSDEMDLSDLPGYTYNPREYNDSISAVYHKALDIKDSAKVAAFLETHPEQHEYYSLNENNQIILTEEAVKKALSLDNTVYESCDPGDYTDDKSVYAKLKIYDLTLGMMAWVTHEGAGAQYTDIDYFTYNQGQSWAPLHNTIYAKYDKNLSKKLSFSNFISFKVHDFEEDNRVVRFRNYRYSTGRAYKLANLLEEDIPKLDTGYLFQKSNQLRNELKILYAPSSKFDILAGFEARYSVIQGDYNNNVTGNAEEEGASLTSMPAGNHFFVRDLGAYAQSTYKIFSSLIITAGLRFDNNIIRNTGGYGTVYNPRLALVYSPGTFVFKAIYAEAFKDATNREKFSTAAGKRELTNPSLEPEKVKNIEASIGKTFFDEALYFNCVGYFARYSNIIQEVKVDTIINGTAITTNQNQGVGQQEVYGVNAFLTYVIGDFNAYANYTFTNPYVIDPLDSERQPVTDENGIVIHRLRISDISNHQANLGIGYLFNDIINISLRTNYIGEKITGEDTNVPLNKADFPAYFLFNGAVTYYNQKTGLSLQLLANNILNKEYYSPGLDQVTSELSAKLPQNGLNLHLKLMFEF